MQDFTPRSTFDPSGLPAWAQEHARHALELLPQSMKIVSAKEAANSSISLTIADRAGNPIGHLVVFPGNPAPRELEPTLQLHIRQIAVLWGTDVIWITLGKLLDPQIAGHTNGVVVRIRKDDGYEVTAISRGTGRPGRFVFREDEIAAVRLSLDG